MLLGATSSRADDQAPKEWEQLFFPFPIVGAPPQLEQQVQLFETYFRGDRGEGNNISAELAYIATPHLGLVLNVPFQIGSQELTTGFGDLSLQVQYLAAGSLRLDDMISVGLSASFPSGRADLSQGDYFVGPFVFAAQRFWHHLIFEGDLTALLPIVHGASARQIAAVGLVSVLVSPTSFRFPIYTQVEVDTTTYLDGTGALPPGAITSPVTTVFIAPEVFLGPFASPISEGTRVAFGTFFNVAGDSEHDHMFTITIALDIPNRYGY
ncbi:MAG TPA: hypothetical protein VHO06_13010 [Polyangia bacterium]|nr:hypothetical protein [Polyangia bacterium]